jgi:putative membrane protein
MKRKNLMMVALAGAFAIQSCQNNTSNSNAGLDKSNDSTLDNLHNNTALHNESDEDDDSNLFLKQAAIGGLMEVQAGNIAIQNAASADVKALAQMIVKDHEAANKELQTFANERNVVLPTELPADKQEHMNSLKKLNGKAFDDHYLKMMREDHKKDIDLFRETSNSSRSKQVRDFAAKILPVLEKHAREVEKVAAK